LFKIPVECIDISANHKPIVQKNQREK